MKISTQLEVGIKHLWNRVPYNVSAIHSFNPFRYYLFIKKYYNYAVSLKLKETYNARDLSRWLINRKNSKLHRHLIGIDIEKNLNSV